MAALTTPVYTGFQPLGACHFQGAANVLEAQGLERADCKVCPSWGFSWDGHSPILRHGDRWIEVLNATHGLRVRRHDFATWADADAAEQGLVARGLPYVAEIDAFEVPSDYEGRDHMPHTVVVLTRDDATATILDCMNHPQPSLFAAEHYARMRSHPCVDAHHLYVSLEPPRRPASPQAIAAGLTASLERHWHEDLARLDAYAEWLAATGETADVARVAGERMYLAGFFSLLGEVEPQLAQAAGAFTSLSRRWYLTHDLAIVTTASGRAQPARVSRVVAGLRTREANLHDEIWPALARLANTEDSHGA